MHARRLAAVTAAAATTALGFGVAASSASAAVTLQPGALSQTATGQCTLNFAYSDGAGNVYMGSAAHCVSGVKDVVSDADGVAWGDVALVGNADSTVDDYSFIKVRQEALGRVSPRVKGSPQYPTGVATADQTRFGNTVALSGFGLGFQFLKLTQERRIGVFNSDDEGRYTVLAQLLFGDSGGPIVYTGTGGALGIVSRLCVGAGLCTEEGPTVNGILTRARTKGLELSLMT